MTFPHTQPMTSFWLSAAADLANHRTTEILPQEADVVIIGSGYSGSAAAYFLLANSNSDGDTLSTVILEARQVCSGATGRNGGHLKPDTYYSAAENYRKYGSQIADELIKFECQQVLDVKRLVETENIDCDFELTRAIDVFTDQQTADSVLQIHNEMKVKGFSFPDDLHVIADPKRAEQVSGVKGAKAALTFTAGSVWPYKLVDHLLRRSIEMGANLQTNTPVQKISHHVHGADGRHVVTTDRGDILARKIIVASNAYTGALFPEFRDKIIPVRGVVCRIAVPPEDPDSGHRARAPHLNNSYAIRFNPEHFDYLVSKTDGSIVVGGADRCAVEKESYWYGNTDDSQLIPDVEEYFTGYMQRMFNGWEDSKARITDIWSGIMGWSTDSMPFVGEMHGHPPGIFVTAGFTGHGMPRILGCSKALAKLVRSDTGAETDDLSTRHGLPRPYLLTAERLKDKKNNILSYARNVESFSSTST
ncbi:hypothetical protein LTR72_004303 [Exophiala xenobiotica]|nr:hypothetical protein LTR92_000528 [Exophiala xenobiotica]KAK5211155.1 hypothetical protein LTR41_003767 [Exophiala xenobiotica]KAK5224522.1 hypothetical protein LTR72_004303 [Exophiala xenobiotica]KAK5293605.1 hypothetical protein LTR14_004496 [Exophiala xenobiotica]KAK5496658.1 hypothetical protein LTR55_001148 [Exophiala xenobiotica]